MKQFENGLEFLENAIKINKEYKNTVALAENFYEMATTFHRGLNDQEKAANYCNKALKELHEHEVDSVLLKGKIWELLGDIVPKSLLQRNQEFLRRNKSIENIAVEALKTKMIEETLKYYNEAISCYTLAEEPDKAEIVEKKIKIVEEDLG